MSGISHSDEQRAPSIFRKLGKRLAAACAMAVLFTGPMIADAAERKAPYTPAVGSEARVAICDALRQHWKKPKTKFVILYLRVDGDWALFDGAAEDDSIAATLRKVDGRWTVAHSWAHGDVPSPEEFTMSKQARGVSPRLLQEYGKAKGF